MRIILAGLIVASATAFTPPAKNVAAKSKLFRPLSRLNASVSIPDPIKKISSSIDDAFKGLPWNIKKEQERLERRMNFEAVQLHRKMGIPEDASYEEIAKVTNALIRACGDDIKARIRIEVARDKILQHRLKARIERVPIEGVDEVAKTGDLLDGTLNLDFSGLNGKPKADEDAMKLPKWARGIWVPPDDAYRNKQLTLWGVLTLTGFLLPFISKWIAFSNFLICIAQLNFRGVKVSGERGMFRRRESLPHQKVSFILCTFVWLLMKVFAVNWSKTFGLYKTKLQTPFEVMIMNTVFMFMSMYLKPYKGASSKDDEDDG